MKTISILFALAAAVALSACGNSDKAQTPAPAAVETQAPAPAPAPADQQPADQAQAAQAPAGQPAGEKQVEPKINISAQPGRTTVITDLHVETGKNVNVGELKFNDPGSKLQFNPAQNVKLRPIPGTVAPQPTPSPEAAGSN